METNPQHQHTSAPSDQPRHGHRFPVERLHLLKDEERLRWLPPELVLQGLHIRAGTVALDIGAGAGFWTLPLSKLVGPEGRVYAIDVEPIMLNELQTVIRDNQLTNVEVVASTELDIPLADVIADVAIAGFVVHEPDDAAAFVREIVRILRPGGQLLVAEWHKKETEQGPPLAPRIAQPDMESMLRDTGLAVEEWDTPNPDVYLLLGTRPSLP